MNNELARNQFEECRNEYMDPVKDTVPDLKDLAIKYDLPFKLVSEACAKDNWPRQRAIKRQTFVNKLEQVETAGIEQVAIDIASARTKLFSDLYTGLNDQLPIVMEQMVERLPAMNNKDFISYAKTLISLSLSLQKQLDAIREREEDKNSAKSGADVLDSILKGHIIQAIRENRPSLTEADIAELEREEAERDNIFERLDG